MTALGDRRALAALLAGAACIGFAPIFVRWIDVGLTAAAFWRVALALPLLGFAWRTLQPAASRGPLSKGLVLAGVFFAADLGVWHQSLRYTSVANSTLLANLAPVFVTAGAAWLFKERIAPRFLLGLALALAGACLLVANSLRISFATVGGDALAALAAVFYAGYQLSVSRQRQQEGASTLDVMWWSTVACAVVLLPVVLALGEPLWPQSPRGWAVLCGLAFVNQVAGQGLITYGMAHLPASFSSVSLLVQPVAAAALAWLLLAEPFGPLQALGGAIVLAGIVMCRFASKQPAA